jgi:hypothetical protein
VRGGQRAGRRAERHVLVLGGYEEVGQLLEFRQCGEQLGEDRDLVLDVDVGRMCRVHVGEFGAARDRLLERVGRQSSGGQRLEVDDLLAEQPA